MEERYDEGLIKGAIDSITIEKTEIILNQMKKCICKVFGNEIGTGFFCKILYQKKLIPVLITSYHVLNDDFINKNKQIKISIIENYEIININENSKIYSSITDEYDIMIIKLNEDKVYNYLEFDQNLFKDNSETLYENESIYILHYPNGGKVSVSYGYGIEKNNNYDIKHLCKTESCSSGGPILNLQSNKVIGFHKAYIKKGDKSFNIGTFLKFPLDEINKNKITNEIRIKLEIGKSNLNEEIYLLDNTNYEDNEGIKHYHDNLKELNESNTELYIDNKKVEYKKYFKPEKEGIYEIILKFNISIKDCSYMFYNCHKIKSIDFISFDTRNVTNMSNMFEECGLESISGISSWDTTNVTNMSLMFCGCGSLKSIPDISNWNTAKVTNMNGMFARCHKLESISGISSWNTANVTDMYFMFGDCVSLQYIPDISIWDVINVNPNRGTIFYNNSKLKSRPYPKFKK